MDILATNRSRPLTQSIAREQLSSDSPSDPPLLSSTCSCFSSTVASSSACYCSSSLAVFCFSSTNHEVLSQRNLLMNRPEIIPCSLSLASSSTVAFCSACYFSCPCSSSSWDFQRLSWSFVTRRLDIWSKCSSDSPCEFRLLSLFFFRVCYLHFLFLFRLCFLLLRLCRFFSFSILFCNSINWWRRY
jgi:hypothetical protein